MRRVTIHCLVVITALLTSACLLAACSPNQTDQGAWKSAMEAKYSITITHYTPPPVGMIEHYEFTYTNSFGDSCKANTVGDGTGNSYSVEMQTIDPESAHCVDKDGRRL